MDEPELQKLAIERYVAGELEKETADRLEAHCETCPNCARYLKKLRQSRDGFLAEHPYAQFKQRISPVDGRPAWYGFFANWLQRPMLMPVYGVLAALLVLLPIAVHRVALVGPGDEILSKGSAHLSFLVKRHGKIAEGNPADAFFADDEIQVLYSAYGKRYISLMSVDSRGGIWMYNPDKNGTTCGIRAQTGANRTYPGSIVLDDSKGLEMIFALLSDKQLKTDEVKKWISAAIKDVAPDLKLLPRQLDSTQGKFGVKVMTLVLRKG